MKYEIDEFVPIEESYGGQQQWLKNYGYISQFYANRSCGISAVGNLTHYLSHNKKGMENLYIEKSNSKEDFTKHMFKIYKFLKPAIYGVPTRTVISKAIIKFAKSRDIILKPVLNKNIPTKENFLAYIQKGLDSNCPVLLITWDTSIKDLQTHWVTVTNLYEKENKYYLVTSNHGKKREYNFDLWYKTSKIYQGALYFE